MVHDFNFCNVTLQQNVLGNSLTQKSYTCTRKVVLAHTQRTIVVQELGFVCMPNLYSSRTPYRRNQGIIGGNFTSQRQPCLFIQARDTCSGHVTSRSARLQLKMPDRLPASLKMATRIGLGTRLGCETSHRFLKHQSCQYKQYLDIVHHVLLCCRHCCTHAVIIIKWTSSSIQFNAFWLLADLLPSGALVG